MQRVSTVIPASVWDAEILGPYEDSRVYDPNTIVSCGTHMFLCEHQVFNVSPELGGRAWRYLDDLSTHVNGASIEWSPEKIYSKLAIVTYDGAMYCSRMVNYNQPPSWRAVSWSLLEK